MRLAGVAFVMGIAMSVVGMSVMVLYSDMELTGDEALVVPEGLDSYVYLEVDMGGGGPISGSFETADGTSVRLSVMDEGQFDDFVDGLGDDARASVLGSSGEFSIEQVDMEVCYIVVRHFPGIESAQSVDVEYTVLTTDVMPFLVSNVLLFAGVAMTFLAMHVRQKAAAKKRTYRRMYTDVVFFDE